jgi:hypothetical protein
MCQINGHIYGQISHRIACSYIVECFKGILCIHNRWHADHWVLAFPRTLMPTKFAIKRARTNEKVTISIADNRSTWTELTNVKSVEDFV